MLSIGQKCPLQLNHMLELSEGDRTNVLLKSLSDAWRKSSKIGRIPRFIVTICRAQFIDFTIVGILTLTEGATRVALPFFFGQLLTALQENNVDLMFSYASALSALSLIQVVSHHVVFFFSMRMGFHWRVAATSLIFDHMLSLQTSISMLSGSGHLISLISTDVAVFDNFATVIHLNVNMKENLYLIFFFSLVYS